METINSFCLSDFTTEIDRLVQDGYEHDSRSVSLHRINTDNADYANDPGLPAGAIVFVECDFCDSNYYLLDPSEIDEALADTSQWLRDRANDWACNTDDYALEMIRWGLSDADDFAAAEDYDGECRIIREGCFYRYTPFEYVTSDEVTDGCEPFEAYVWPSRAAAQEWIDGEQDGTYYLSHNEAGRPTYTIVEA